MKAIYYLWAKFAFFFTILACFSGCGNSSNPTPVVQKNSSDQIVIVQVNPSGGGPGGGVPSGVSISPVSLPQPLFQSTAVTYTDPVSLQSFIYVIGGAYYDLTLSPDPINVNTVHKYLINSNGSLTYLGVENSNLPNLRGHASVIYNNANNSAIYVVGGIGVGGFQKAIYRATITMNTAVTPPVPLLSPWKWVGDLPVEETGHAVVLSGDTMFVIGGVESGLPPFTTCSPNCVGSQSTVFSNKIYGYNLAGFSASSGTTLTTTTPPFIMPKKLFAPAAVGLPNQVWVLGGWDGEVNANSDTAYSVSVTNGILSVGTSCFPCRLPYGGVSKAIGLFMADAPVQQMVLIGGISGSLNTPEIIRQEIYSSQVFSGVPLWSAVPSLPKPVSYFSATSSGSVIYVLGGLY